MAAKKIVSCTGYLQCITLGSVVLKLYSPELGCLFGSEEECYKQEASARSYRGLLRVLWRGGGGVISTVVLCTGYLQCIILGSVISIISSSELGCLFGSEEDCYKQKASACSYRVLLKVLWRGGWGIKNSVVYSTGYLQRIILGNVISIISSSELGCLFGSEEDCYKQKASARSYRGLLRVLWRGGWGIKNSVVYITGYQQCIILGSVISVISWSELGCLFGSEEDCNKQEAIASSYRGLLRFLWRGGGGVKNSVVYRVPTMYCCLLGGVVSTLY